MGPRDALRCVFATQHFFVFLKKFLSQEKINVVSMHHPSRDITYSEIIDFRDGQYLRAQMG